MTTYDHIGRGYDWGMWPLERLALRRLRRRLFSHAYGRVLELGVGTGVNLPFYSPSVRLAAMDASAAMLARAGARPTRAARLGMVQADVEALPLTDASFERVYASLLFCSVADPAAALAEVRRVLRPGGWLVLLEHVRGAGGPMRWLTDALAAPWLRLSKSCHLDRETGAAVAAAGFRVVCASRHVAGIVEVILARRPEE